MGSVKPRDRLEHLMDIYSTTTDTICYIYSLTNSMHGFSCDGVHGISHCMWQSTPASRQPLIWHRPYLHNMVEPIALRTNEGIITQWQVEQPLVWDVSSAQTLSQFPTRVAGIVATLS